MSLRFNDNCKPFFKNDQCVDVKSFSLVAGDLEIALGSGEKKHAPIV